MEKSIRLLTFLIIIICSAFDTSGNNTETYSNLRFKAFSTHEGLSQSSVLSITQDAQGFIWMGTKDGLNRYDGYNFITFKNQSDNQHSISNNEIIYLTADQKGNLFVGTRGGGLNYYIKDENRFLRFEGLRTMDGTVSTVMQQPDGSIWVGTNLGLFYGSPDSTREHHFNFSNFSNKSVYLDTNGALLPYDRAVFSVVTVRKLNNHTYLVGTYKGLFIFKMNDYSFTQIDLGMLNNAKINSMVMDQQGLLWVATSEGMIKLEIIDDKVISTIPLNNNPKWKKLNISWIESLICDHEGNIWAGTRGAGIIQIDKDGEVTDYFNNKTLSNQIGDNIINSLLIDRTGVLWMGTESRGAVTLDLNRKKFNHLENNTETGRNLNSNLVTAITGRDNIVWVGSAYNGLDYLQFNADNTVTTKRFNQIPYSEQNTSSEVISLMLDNEDILWIGTASNNLVAYRNDFGFKSYFTGGFAFAIHQDLKKDIWIGTWGKGLGLMDKKSRNINFFANQPDDSRTISGDIILSVFEDNKGNLWVGTKGRGLNVAPLNMVKQGYNNFVIFEKEKHLLHNDVYCIIQDSDDIIWIGTGGGLNRLDLYHSPDTKTDLLKGRAVFESFTEKDGLPANLIYGIKEDHEGNLWISTTKGLSKYNKETKTFKNYTSDDGLQSDEFHSNAFYSTPEKKMFFGGINGLTFFDPKEILKTSNPSSIIISGLKVANLPVLPHQKVNGKIILDRDISKAESITLTHKHKDFSIEFSSDHFNSLEGVKYAYRLLGFNDEWRYLYANEHAVSYTNLWEGDYVFQVKSTNKDGIWNETPRELKIEVLPPIWRNRWSFIIYLFIVAIGLLLFRRYTLIGVAEKNRLLIEHIERTNLIENTEAKMRFFTNISHEIRTPLTLISNPLEDVIANGKIDEKAKDSLLLVSKNVNRLLNLTNQLLQLRKIDKGGVEPQYAEVTVVKFLKEIIGYFLQKALNKEITMSFDSDVNADEKIWIDKELITTAIYNVISNAYKFTPSKGRITIRLYKKWDDISTIDKLRRKNPNDGKQWLCIEVSDTGPGISNEEIQNIFHRFYQSKQNNKKEYAGSGIGLSIVKDYVDLHQGKVETRSKVGEGSTFTIFLPMGDMHIKSKQMAAQTNDTDTTIQPFDDNDNEELKNSTEVFKTELPTILVVEDDKDLCNYLTNNLSKNFNVITANDGKIGIEKAFEHLPQLIISDVMMPNTDGLELCETVKNNEQTRHIPIILLTAKAADESKIEGYKSGADLYVSKPFKIDVLKSEIDQLLNSRKLLSDIFSKQIYLEPRNIEISSADDKFLTKLNETIDQHLSESDFDVAAMVEKMNQSHSTVLKKVKSLTGMSLVEFVKIHRLKRAAQILEKDRFQIAEVAYLVGFSDPKYFSKCFSKEFGKTPTEYVQEIRNKHEGK